jgi:putative oxidoreductase
MTDLAILILRLGLGIMFFAHGLQMALGKFGGPGVQGFAKMLSSMGFTPAILWSYIACYTVLIGGAFLVFGIMTRVSALLLLIFIAVAGIKVHLAKGFFLQSGGYEYTFVIACVCLALIILGGGKFSLTKNF